jgi:L-gulonolactone oxidase
MLSPAYGRPVCDLEAVTARGTRGADAFYADFSAAMLAFPSARPHWGKYILSPEAIRERYPRMDDFLRIRREIDPGGVFLNDFLARRVFGLG